MEKFEIEDTLDEKGYEIIRNVKRNLEIQVIHTDKLPAEMPDEALIVTANYNDAMVKYLTCFCILEPDDIKYEPLITNMLISGAVEAWFKGQMPGRTYTLSYSPAYRERYLNRPTDPKKIPPILLAWINRPNKIEDQDYYEWLDKNLPKHN